MALLATKKAWPARGAALAFLLAGGCAHQSGEQPRIEELTRTVESLRTQNAAYQKQIEELENRVFILSDQVDSRKVNAERVAMPELPRVTLKPSSVKSAVADPADDRTATTSEPDVEYSGDAAKTSGKRPVLRLYGDETPVLTTRDPARDERPLLVDGETARSERAPAPPRPSGSPVDLYRRSLESLRAGHHEEAIAGFHEFLQRHAGHELADNAQYWLGECSYDRKDYVTAAREFRRVVDRYPQGNKVPDALLKLGYSYISAGNCEAGRQALEQVVRAYPRHDAATLATSRLAGPGCSGAAPDGRLPTTSKTEAP
jgi:tol-pal system protein YbgF